VSIENETSFLESRLAILGRPGPENSVDAALIDYLNV